MIDIMETTQATQAFATPRFKCSLCQQNVEDTHPRRSFVTQENQRGLTAHTSCLKSVSWTPELQFSPSVGAGGRVAVLTITRMDKGAGRRVTWSGLRVRVEDATRRDHRCAWCKETCGDDEDLDTVCVLNSHLKTQMKWHTTLWMHKSCADAALEAKRLVRIANNYHCFSGLRIVH